MSGQQELRSGKKGATDPANVTSTPIDADKQGLDVVVDSITNPVTVQGTVTIDPGTLATAAKQDTGNTSLATLAGAVAGNEVQVDVLSMPSTAVTGPLTDAQLRATAVPVDPSAVTSPVSIAGTVAADVTDDATRDLGKVDVASLDQYTPVSGRLPVDGSGVTQPVSGTVNPATAFGKTITYVPVAQGAAGTTELAAASGSNKHKIIGGMLTMSLAGTLKFTDGVADLTGPMNFAANGGMVVPESPVPFCQTGAVNRALNLVTTLGAASGILAILTEP